MINVFNTWGTIMKVNDSEWHESERQPSGWEKSFVKHISDKGLRFRIYKKNL